MSDTSNWRLQRPAVETEEPEHVECAVCGERIEGKPRLFRPCSAREDIIHIHETCYPDLKIALFKIRNAVAGALDLVDDDELVTLLFDLECHKFLDAEEEGGDGDGDDDKGGVEAEADA